MFYMRCKATLFVLMFQSKPRWIVYITLEISHIVLATTNMVNGKICEQSP
jgi:hypothetical protein